MMSVPPGDTGALPTNSDSWKDGETMGLDLSDSESPKSLAIQLDESLERQILSTAMDVADYEVRLTVLGLAGIVVDASKLYSKKKWKGERLSKRSPLKPPSQMKGVVALSREHQKVVSVSDLSKPIGEAGIKKSNDRYVAIWPSEDATTSNPTFKFETKLRSVGSAHAAIDSKITPKTHEEIELLVALSEDSDTSEVALPIGVASLTLSRDMSKIGKHVVDLPVRPLQHKASSQSKNDPNFSVIQLAEDAATMSKPSPLVKGSQSKLRFLKKRFSKKQPGIFVSKNPSLEHQEIFSEVYQTDSSGDSMLRVQLEVLHKITGGIAERMNRMPSVENSMTHSCDKSAATPVHQNTSKNDGQSSCSSEGEVDLTTCVEVTTEATYNDVENRYVDVVCIQGPDGQETKVPRTSEEATQSEDNEEATAATTAAKQTSSELLDSLLPSSLTEESKAERPPIDQNNFSESKEDLQFSQSYVSCPRSVKSYSEDLGARTGATNHHPNTSYGCNALSNYTNEWYGDDYTDDGSTLRGIDDEETFYTNQGGRTLGNDTFETIGSIDFWTIDGWCTAGTELLNGEIPNVYDGRSLVSGTQHDEGLSRRVLGWKRHLQRMKIEAKAHATLSQGSGTFDDTTVTNGENESAGASHECQITTADTVLTPDRKSEDYVHAFESVKSSKTSIEQGASLPNDGSPLRVDAIGTIQRSESKNMASPQQKLSQRVAGLFTCEGSSKPGVHYEPYGKGEVPGMVGDIDLERNISLGEMTEITHDVALNRYSTTRLLSTNKEPRKSGDPILSCLCPSHPDDFSLLSLAAITDDENENYFAEYDDYSVLAPAVKSNASSSSQAEI